MTQHNPIVRIHHMLDHAREAVEMADGRTRDDLDSDRMLVLALIRLLEVTGKRRRTFHSLFGIKTLISRGVK